MSRPSLPNLCAALYASARSGAWLTPGRLRIYPMMLACFLIVAVAGLVVTGHDGKDYWGRPLGVDFSGVWVAGQEVRAGHVAQPYDNAAHAAAQTATFGRSDSFLPWPYPPYGLAIAAALATLPYLAALALWQLGTFGLYAFAVVRVAAGSGLARREILVAAFAFPAGAVNILHGQNGFLSAGLLALGGLWLPSRQILAGVLLGLLVYKPQFAIVVPVALVAGGYARAAWAAAATVALATLATWVMFGAEPWIAFAKSLSFTRHVILESGGLESYKLQSAFAAVRLIGGSVAMAYAFQGVVTLAVLCALFRLWRGSGEIGLKVAALLVAGLLTTPYVVDYDQVMLGPALAALIAHGLTRGFAPWERSLAALAWSMPLVARGTAMTIGLPVGFLVTAAVYAILLRRARADQALACRGTRWPWSRRASQKFMAERDSIATVSYLTRCHFENKG